MVLNLSNDAAVIKNIKTVLSRLLFFSYKRCNNGALFLNFALGLMDVPFGNRTFYVPLSGDIFLLITGTYVSYYDQSQQTQTVQRT